MIRKKLETKIWKNETFYYEPYEGTRLWLEIYESWFTIQGHYPGKGLYIRFNAEKEERKIKRHFESKINEKSGKQRKIFETQIADCLTGKGDNDEKLLKELENLILKDKQVPPELLSKLENAFPELTTSGALEWKSVLSYVNWT